MSVSAVLRAIRPVRMAALYARPYRVQAFALDRAPRPRHLPGMSDETPDSLIPYDEIVQEALRAVVGRVRGSVERGGGTLPGDHHFYITFKTAAPGVQIPQHLRERFPDEMTIVLQKDRKSTRLNSSHVKIS